jgi:hypothetical protein
MSLAEAFAYFRSYDKASFEVYACQGHEPSEADITGFEREVGFGLPEEFREFTKSSLGGLYMAVREAVWPRPKEFDVGPFWSFLYGLTVYGIAFDIPEDLDLRAQFREFRAREEFTAGLVPFLKIIGDADPYCFTAQGGIVRWLHEEPETPESVSLSFSDLLMQEIRALEERKAKKLSHPPVAGA